MTSEPIPPAWLCEYATHAHLTLSEREADQAREFGARVVRYGPVDPHQAGQGEAGDVEAQNRAPRLTAQRAADYIICKKTFNAPAVLFGLLREIGRT